MMKLSVFLAAIICCQTVSCRRLIDQIETNEIDTDPPSNEGFLPRVRISQPPLEYMTKTLGSRVEFECEAVGSPMPVMQWLKGRQPLTENESYDSNSIIDNPLRGMAKVKTRLVINHILPIHRGTYTCLAESGSQIVTAESELHVAKSQSDFARNYTTLVATQILGAHHRPRITLWVSMLMDILGSDVILPCQTVGNPKPEIVWFDTFGNEVSNGNGRVTVLPDGALRIRAITWNDMGPYTCLSRNSLGQDSVESFLYPLKEAK